MEDQFDHILVVSASEELRRQRVHERSQLSDAEFLERSANQLPPEFKEQRASEVIRNDGDVKQLTGEVVRALKALGVPLPTAANP